YCWRIWAITLGSRSSPAITSAGSPGNRCCSEKIRIDTKNNVGISCSTRLPRKFSMAFLSLAAASLQLQPDHAHQPVRHLLVAFQLGGVGDQELAVIEIDDRLVVEHESGDLLVDRLALFRIADEARLLKPLVGLRVGIFGVVQRRAVVQEDVGIAVGIDPAAPVDLVRLEFAGLGLLEGGCEFKDADLQI